MKKRFAEGESSGPSVANFQLKFWRVAVRQFDTIVATWREQAVENPCNEYADYTEDDFVEDASVAIVLAGTSVSILIGQNVPPETNRHGEYETPAVRRALASLFGELPDHWDAFLTRYNRLRHFGEAYHDFVGDISEESLCECMTTAQEIWRKLMERRRWSPGEEFNREFAFR